MGFCSLPPQHFDEYSSYGVSVTSQSSPEKQNEWVYSYGSLMAQQVKNLLAM